MIGSRKLLLAASVFGVVGFFVVDAMATDVDLAGTLTASAAVTIASSTDFDFAGIDFTGVYSGTIELGPDGNAAITSGSNLSLTGTPVPAQIDITNSLDTINVSCDATGVLSDGTRTVAISEVKWDFTAATYALAANTCGGLGIGGIQLDTTGSNNPSIFVGAELTVLSGDFTGSVGTTPFTTAAAGGDPITFRIVIE